MENKKLLSNVGEILPNELLEEIFLDLTPRALVMAKKTCRFWASLIDESLLLNRAMMLRPQKPSEYLLWQTTSQASEWHSTISSTPVAKDAATGARENSQTKIISKPNPALPVGSNPSWPKTYISFVANIGILRKANSATLLLQPPCFRCTVNRVGSKKGITVTASTGVTMGDVLLAAESFRSGIRPVFSTQKTGDGGSEDLQDESDEDDSDGEYQDESDEDESDEESYGESEEGFEEELREEVQEVSEDTDADWDDVDSNEEDEEAGSGYDDGSEAGGIDSEDDLYEETPILIEVFDHVVEGSRWVQKARELAAKTD